MGCVAPVGGDAAAGRRRRPVVRGGRVGARPVPRRDDPGARGSGDRRADRAVRCDPRGARRVRVRRRRLGAPVAVGRPAFDVMHQTWVREPDTGVYRLDIFREPHDGDMWICRRDDASVCRTSRSSDDARRHPVPGPGDRPPLQGEARRPKDEADFAGTLPLLSPERRAWLRGTLASVHPEHRWLGALA